MPEAVTWLPVCAGLSALGVVVAFLAFRRRGLTAALRILGWAALPMAAYLTGAVTLLWRIGVDIARFAVRFAFSTTVWLGVAVFGLAVVLFVVSGVLRGRRRGAGAAESGSSAGAPSTKGGKPPPEVAKGPREVGKGAGSDDAIEGLDDIEEILRRRGIQ